MPMRAFFSFGFAGGLGLGLAMVSSTPAKAQIGADAPPPSVSIAAPAASSTVAGVVNITANARNNVGVADVMFLVDGAIQADDTTRPCRPYSVSWISTAVTDGAHDVTAANQTIGGNRQVTATSHNEMWVAPHEFAFRQVSGSEAFYPDTDQDNNWTRDDYLAEVTNINNWTDIIATGKTIVFGLHIGGLSPVAFRGYSARPFTDAQLAQLAQFINEHHFKVSIETGGLRLNKNEKLIADPDCPEGDMTCAGEGRRTADFEMARYLKRWLDVGGRIDYIIADHPILFAARSIANPTFNIRRDTTHDASAITITDIVQELLNYYAEIDAVLADYHVRAGKPYASVEFAMIDGPSEYTIVGDRTGRVYPSRLRPTLLNAGDTTFSTIVNILAAQVNNAEFSPSVAARLRKMAVIFDAGPQVVLADGNGSQNFERILTAEHVLSAAGFRPMYIIHPGAFAYSPTYAYTDADVTCAESSACDKSPSGVLSLANEMAQYLDIHLLEEYLRAGGTPESVLVDSWHRYPSATGPSQTPFTWFNTVGHLSRLISSAPAIVGSEPAASTRGALALDSSRVERVLTLRHNGPSTYREDRYSLPSATSESYQSITMEQMTASSIERGVTVSIRVELGANGAGWFALHFGKPTSDGNPISMSGVSVLVSDNRSVSICQSNHSGECTTLAMASAAAPTSKIVNLRVILRGATIWVYADYKQVIAHRLSSIAPLLGYMSIDSHMKDATAYNVISDWH